MPAPVDWHRIKRYALVIALTAFFMGWLAPGGSSVLMSTADRYLFWTTTVTLGWLQMIVVAYGVRAAFGTERFAGWQLMLIAAAAGAVPIAFEVRHIWAALSQDGVAGPYWRAYLTVLVINVNFSLVQWRLVENWPLSRAADTGAALPVDRRASGGAADRAAVPHVSMLRRRPDGLDGSILCLQIEDHYLRVYTDQGEGLVLHRMADAVAELAGADGMQVHRSWWVAGHAVRRTRTRNRRREIELANGLVVPVGRSFVAGLRARGWLGGGPSIVRPPGSAADRRDAAT